MFFIDMRNVKGPTLDLYNAAVRGDIAKMKTLIETKKANVNGHIAPQGATPLHAAVWNNKHFAIALLLEYGAKVNEEDNGGWTPFHCAASVGNPEVISYLLSKGACVNSQTKITELTALHIAAHEGKREAVLELLKNNASLGIRDNEGKSPYEAIENEEIKNCLQGLLEIDNKNKYVKT